eukprot:scaffold25431_cov22-Tisochrysis_lutea.AAC.1
MELIQHANQQGKLGRNKVCVVVVLCRVVSDHCSGLLCGAVMTSRLGSHALVMLCRWTAGHWRLPTTAVDVVYYRYRPVGGRRLAYKEACMAPAVYCMPGLLIHKHTVSCLPVDPDKHSH